jgi:hypothetical protein
MLEVIERHAGVIRSAALSDPHGPGAAEFELEVGFLKKQLPELRRRLEHFVSGAKSTPLVLDVERTASFETADSYGIYSGTLLLANPASTVSVELNTSSPIADTQSLRMRFDFANESAAWGQWMFYSVPLAVVPTDLTSPSGLRFKARTNTPRSFRVEVESPMNSKANEGIKMGWDVVLSSETTQLTVMFADARVPSWAVDPGDSLAGVLRSATGISFKPECANRDSSGQLPAGTSDNGWVDLDDVEFF